MMSINDHDFLKELASDPFPQKGFSPRLKKQIQRELNWKAVSRKSGIFRLFLVASGLGLIVLVVLLYSELPFNKEPSTTMMAEQTKPELEQIQSLNVSQKAINSVLLIGLRTDDTNGMDGLNGTEETNGHDSSTYRSLMVADSGKRLRIVAEGSGILIPYGQEFWKIQTAVHKSAQGIKSRVLEVHPAKSLSDASDSAPQRVSSSESFSSPGNGLSSRNIPTSGNGVSDSLSSTDKHSMSEKLLFASQNYISFSVRENAQEHIWMQSIKQVAEEESPNKSHISLQDLFGGEAKGDNWTLSRKTGQWKVRIADDSKQDGTKVSQLSELPLALPQSVVSHDQLVCTWDEVITAQPDAIDAVSAPEQDMIAIMTKTNIYVYAYSGQIGRAPLLSIGLNPNESLVMVQWATEKYAESWIVKGVEYLND